MDLSGDVASLKEDVNYDDHNYHNDLHINHTENTGFWGGLCGSLSSGDKIIDASLVALSCLTVIALEVNGVSPLTSIAISTIVVAAIKYVLIPAIQDLSAQTKQFYGLNYKS